MNITEALNAALPDMPAKRVLQGCPRLDPAFSVKEHVEDGKPIFRVYVPSAGAMYKFPPQNWNLVQLFDGKRSYEEIAEIYSRQSGNDYSAAAIREFASELESVEFWYKTPQEKNILMMQKSSEERHKLLKAKKKYGDISLYAFPAVNPDKFLSWLYRYTSFVYTQWFTVLTLCAFAFTAWITIVHWPEIGRDTLQFYNFSKKSWADFVQFYVLAVFVLCFHEIGHGHACKHYGARVPAMGFALIYLAPAFYTDTTEGEVKGTRYQRLVISVAGVWAELLVCAVATPIWWNTPPDTLIHNCAYIVLLITGLSAALINWNPLIKLDGYHMMCEILGIVDLKESSTAFASAWVKRKIWRLPVEVPYIPKRRRLPYFIYAILSGLYSYTVLYIVARFVGNVFRNFNPEWSFIPELGTAGLIFRSRIVMLVNFMKFVYLDKKDRVRAWFTPIRRGVAIAIVAAVALVPIRYEAAGGPFVLEPSRRALIRALVPGMVTAVSAREGAMVAAGESLVKLRNVPLQLTLTRSESDYAVAADRATSAALRYRDFGQAAREKDRLAQQTAELSSETANLDLASPFAGIVLTARPEDRIGSYVTRGSELLEVGEVNVLRARIFVPEHELYKIHAGARAQIEVTGMARKWDALAVSISPLQSEAEPGLIAQSEYKGLQAPHFYVADLRVDNLDAELRPGMAGSARIFGERRSIGGFVWVAVRNFISRKVW